MLKRIVKEAARAATSSGGESSDRRTGTPRRRRAAASSPDEDARQKKRRDADSDDDDSDGGDAKEKKAGAVAKKNAKKNNNRASSGDESDRKGGTTSATTNIPRNAASTNLFKNKLQSKLKRMWNAGKMKRAPLLELATIEAVHSAMHGKDKKRARTKLLEMFAQYDTEETGGIGNTRFIKCITKAGVHLRKPADYDALVHCFAKRSSVSSEDDDDESAGEKKNRKTMMSKMVDYVAFVDFACNVRDSEKLSQIADKLNKIIDKYDDKHNQSTTEPFNVSVGLKKLDKKKRKWIPSEQFAAFLQEHERPVFKLSPKEVQALTERFEYEYGKDELGVDYEQCARWLQPMLHLDIKELHKRVQDLVKKANERGGWDLVEVFQAMDNDGDGEVSGAELKEALLEMGLPLTDTQIRCLVDEYDTNGDGRIQYEEFIALFPFLKKDKNKDAKGSESAKKKEKKNGSEEGDESGDSRSDRKTNGKKKNTRKNTFSWDIGKAFARKHSTKGNSSTPTAKKKSTVKKKKQASKESSDNSRENAKGRSAKAKTKVVVSSSDEERDTDQRRKPTKRAASSAKKKRRDSTSEASGRSQESSSEKQTARRGRDQKAKRSDTRRDPSSTETDEESRVKTKPKSKKGSKLAVTTDDSDAKKSPSPATESSAKPRSPRKKKKVNAESSPTKRRSDRQLSTVSHRSHRSARRSQSRSRSRQRFASTASSTARRPKARSRSRVDRHTRSSSRKSPRRVPRHFDHNDDDGDATSSAESEHDSESSGLDMSQLRQLKKETRRYEGSEDDDHLDDGDDDADEAEHIRTRSDGEYEKHLKRSLRRAFDFFDLDQSDTIEKKELSHVLRALGHEFTTQELDDEMARADLDQNGQLDFHEFVAFVKRQLMQKQFLLSKRREMEIRQAFQSLDNDKNGVLDEKEFEYLIYKVLGVELSVEEQDALLDFVDENGDGIINEDEFIAFMRVMEDFHKAQGGKGGDRQKQFLRGLEGTSKLALTAMKKLVRGAPIDLDRNLLMFFGVPTNFRPAISSFATCRALQGNTLEHVLSFPSPQMIVALAQDSSQNGADKKSGSMFGSAAPAVKSPEDTIDESALLQQAESWQSQAIASLKRATGVPKPFDTREEDVVKRCVHVCLFQEQEEMQRKSTTSRASAAVANKKRQRAMQQPKTGGGAVVGNVHEIPVYWHPGQEDVWEFSKKATKENKYKFLVRTNTVNDHLYLLVEFIIHLRMAKREETRKGKRRHRRHKSKSSKRGDTASGDEDATADGSGETREMVCCWCKIPIRTLLAKRAGVFRDQLKLWGGTAHAPVDIEQDEILRRRTGWRALANVFTKPTPPAMGIKSVPIELFPEELQSSVRKMPSTIIAPFLSLPVLAEYMTLMKTMLSSGNGSSAGKQTLANLMMDGMIYNSLG